MGNSSIGLWLVLKYIPEKQKTHAVAFSRMEFADDESNNVRVCFAIINFYIAQSDLVTQAKMKSDLGLNRNRIVQDKMKKRSKSGNWRNVQKRKKNSNNRRMRWPYIMESSQELLFLSFPQTPLFGFDKNALDKNAPWEERNWGVYQNDSFVAWHYPKRSTFCSSLRIKKVVSLVYHQQVNGLAEREVQKVRPAL